MTRRSWLKVAVFASIGAFCAWRAFTVPEPGFVLMWTLIFVAYMLAIAVVGITDHLDRRDP